MSNTIGVAFNFRESKFPRDEIKTSNGLLQHRKLWTFTFRIGYDIQNWNLRVLRSKNISVIMVRPRRSVVFAGPSPQPRGRFPPECEDFRYYWSICDHYHGSLSQCLCFSCSVSLSCNKPFYYIGDEDGIQAGKQAGQADRSLIPSGGGDGRLDAWERRAADLTGWLRRVATPRLIHAFTTIMVRPRRLVVFLVFATRRRQGKALSQRMTTERAVNHNGGNVQPLV